MQSSESRALNRPTFVDKAELYGRLARDYEIADPLFEDIIEGKTPLNKKELRWMQQRTNYHSSFPLAATSVGVFFGFDRALRKGLPRFGPFFVRWAVAAVPSALFYMGMLPYVSYPDMFKFVTETDLPTAAMIRQKLQENRGSVMLREYGYWKVQDMVRQDMLRATGQDVEFEPQTFRELVREYARKRRSKFGGELHDERHDRGETDADRGVALSGAHDFKDKEVYDLHVDRAAKVSKYKH